MPLLKNIISWQCSLNYIIGYLADFFFFHTASLGLVRTFLFFPFRLVEISLLSGVCVCMFYADLFISICGMHFRNELPGWHVERYINKQQTFNMPTDRQTYGQTKLQCPPRKEKKMRCLNNFPCWLQVGSQFAAIVTRFDMQLKLGVGGRSFAHLAQIAVFFGECTTPNGPIVSPPPLSFSPSLPGDHTNSGGYANRARAHGLIKVSSESRLEFALTRLSLSLPLFLLVWQHLAAFSQEKAECGEGRWGR